MKTFNYSTAINQLGLDKTQPINTNIRYDKIPTFVQGSDFLHLFLPFLTIYGDSREQDNWLFNYLNAYGIKTIRCVKNKKEKTENLKEGDYTFAVTFGDKIYDYTGVCTYERKGSVSEFYGNAQKGRKRVKKEFDRCNVKGYDKIVLMLQFGDKLTDLINLKFQYYSKNGKPVVIDTGYTLYSTVLSWCQPNNNDFRIIQSNDKNTLMWLMLQDMYYYFRQEIRLECIDKNLIENI